MSERLPCPFCGSADINTEGPCYTQFMCNGCGASTYEQSTREEAFAAWNNRVDQAGNEEGVRRALLKHLPPLSDDDEYNRVFQALLEALTPFLLLGERRQVSDQINQIRAAHLAARPKPAVNPAWANAEHDIGVLLAEIERLRTALEFYRDGFTFHTNPRRAGLEWKPTETLLDDCGNVARIALSDDRAIAASENTNV